MCICRQICASVYSIFQKFNVKKLGYKYRKERPCCNHSVSSLFCHLLESTRKRKDREAREAREEEDEDEEEGRKKMRTTFTGKQIFELERTFETKKYLSSSERAEMAAELRVTQQQVTI